jgi:hypothetical protein
MWEIYETIEKITALLQSGDDNNIELAKQLIDGQNLYPYFREKYDFFIYVTGLSLYHIFRKTAFDLGESNLKTIPSEIGDLTNIKYLYLNDNKLQTLPDEICNLTKLVKLDVRENDLIQMPIGLGAIKDLKIYY